jgi:hypothetical protein
MTKRRKATGAGGALSGPSERETLDALVASFSDLNLDQLALQW